MPKISIGIATTGKEIAIVGRLRRSEDIGNDFQDFSPREMFDAFLALEYLTLSEERRGTPDSDWLECIKEARLELSNRIESTTLELWKNRLGIDSAFAARDYGKALVHAHFRWL